MSHLGYRGGATIVHRARVYPPAINALGEGICPGCGAHLSEARQAFCSNRCRMRVETHGGRLTREDIDAALALLDSDHDGAVPGPAGASPGNPHDRVNDGP